MSESQDWLECTWQIKRDMAAKYADRSASEQVRDMRATVLREWEKRGWPLTEAELPTRVGGV